MFIYLKVFLAVMFGWLLYATLLEATASAYSVFRNKSLTFMDDQIGERVLVVGKDSKKIAAILCQHVLIATIFAFALFLMIR
jgi:hypothetical protein